MKKVTANWHKNTVGIYEACVCMLKGRLCGDVHGTVNRLGQGKGSLYGPIFLTSRAISARVTPPTAYYRLLECSAANFALGTKGLPRGHGDQSGIPRPIYEGWSCHSVAGLIKFLLLNGFLV